MSILKRIFDKKGRAKKVWNKLFCPEPCPDCKGYDVGYGIIVYDGTGKECFECRTCGAKWRRRPDGFLDAYQGRVNKDWWEEWHEKNK